MLNPQFGKHYSTLGCREGRPEHRRKCGARKGAAPLPHGRKKNQTFKALIIADISAMAGIAGLLPVSTLLTTDRYRDVCKHKSEHFPTLLRTRPQCPVH